MSKEHTILPIYNAESKILILGSFPSEKSREAGFFYMHPQNRFWPLISNLLNKELPKTINERRQMLLDSKIALYDVIKSCDISGSSDSSISNVIPNDIRAIVDYSNIKAIYCNGNKAYTLYKKYISPQFEKEKIEPILLPSTSPANAAYSMDALISSWSRIKISLSRENKSYYSLNDFCEQIYGKKLYKLSINGGFTCPNRDGKIDTRGCIFCDGGGAGDFGGDRQETIEKQIEGQKKLMYPKLPKTKAVGYIGYFQAFTNTYGPVDKLKTIYEEVAKRDDIDIISIATRPDCLDKNVLALLSELRQIKPVWIELGLQTKHESTAKYIRRGYDSKIYEKSVKELQKIGIDHIITHIILGLPGEDVQMMKESVSYVVASGGNGIKLQLLHVLKNTDLAKDYEDKKFNVLSEDEYIDILKEIISIMPYDMVIHRLTGDGNKKNLIAPLWSGNKKEVINRINISLSDSL